ncbi:uncharacterized protein [Hetaerina americana]|uniref:uncharacterized protein isoform X2 n=1 Tax=Hetaerina americana TaxID=62018 RepID=UPI003A7F4114
MARVLGVPRVASCSVVPAAGKGDNYASVVYKCVVRVDEGDERRVIVKCLPANALRQMFCNKAQIFRKERDMYTRILPRYESMLSAVQPGRTSFPWPEHYASEVDGKQDFVALKDLGPQGFSMAQRMTGLDEDHLSLVLSAFGEFHACSAAHRVLTPTEAFQAEVVVPFQEFMYSEDVQDMATWVEKSVEMTAGIVEAWGGSYEAVGRWIARWARGAHAQMRDLLTVERPGTLLCHGDAWINNMLFRHHRSSEGQEAKPAEVKLLDFQIARYSSPVTDLLYLMVTSTTSAIRKQHWDRLLEREYLGSFWRTLELLGVKESFGLIPDT